MKIVLRLSIRLFPLSRKGCMKWKVHKVLRPRWPAHHQSTTPSLIDTTFEKYGMCRVKAQHIIQTEAKRITDKSGSKYINTKQKSLVRVYSKWTCQIFENITRVWKRYDLVISADRKCIAVWGIGTDIPWLGKVEEKGVAFDILIWQRIGIRTQKSLVWFLLSYKIRIILLRNGKLRLCTIFRCYAWHASGMLLECGERLESFFHQRKIHSYAVISH